MSYIYTIRGPVFSAKSTLGLSLPGRKYVFDLELGVKRAAWRFDEADIEIWQPEPDLSLLSYSKKDRVQGQSERWTELCRVYTEILSRDDIQVIVLDTAKEAWTICHKGWLQEKQDQQLEDAQAKNSPEDSIHWQQTLGQFDYGTPNTRFYNLMELAKQFDKDLVLINHEKDVYGPTMVKGEIVMMPTGQKELDGFSHTIDRADWVLVTSNSQIPGENGTYSIQFKAVIAKSPVGKDLVGMEIEKPDYDKLMNLAKAYGYVSSEPYPKCQNCLDRLEGCPVCNTVESAS